MIIYIVLHTLYYIYCYMLAFICVSVRISVYTRNLERFVFSQDTDADAPTQANTDIDVEDTGAA